MYFRPAEWRKGKILWLAWPYDRSLWGDDLRPAQHEFIALINSLRNEQLVVLFPDHDALNEASLELNGNHLAFKVMPYGDIWLRDTLPIFVKDERGQTAAILPNFNGWGGKYLFRDDQTLSGRVADLLLVPKISSSLTFEGGSIECDGAGTLITTEQCLLNANRQGLDKKTIEIEFEKLFGAKKVIWLKEGLKNDHTDGHVDTIARFIGPQKIAIMSPSKNDPNRDTLLAIKKELEAQTDAKGNRFELLEIPSPGAIKNREGELMPASYLNFIIGDETMVVPTYQSIYDDEAVHLLAEAVRLDVVGLSAKAILTGGGAFHCISQEYYR